MLDGGARFWFRGELFPLAAELLRSDGGNRQHLRQLQQQVEQERLEGERLMAKLRELGVDPEA